MHSANHSCPGTRGRYITNIRDVKRAIFSMEYVSDSIADCYYMHGLEARAAFVQKYTCNIE